MENERPTAAWDVLRDLDADRSALAGRMAASAWVHTGFGLIAAGYVLMPVLGDELRSRTLPFLVLVVLGLLWYHRSVTGIRPTSVGARAWTVVAGAAVAILVLFSVSLGLVASLSPWWAVVPAVAAFGLVRWANTAFEKLTREHVRRGV